MKIQVREGVFETNSSSTHAISICLKEDWERFRKGELWMCPDTLNFLPKDEAIKFNEQMIEDLKIDYPNREDIMDMDWAQWELYHDYHSYTDYNEYEWFIQETTLSDTVTAVAYGYYGYDY